MGGGTKACLRRVPKDSDASLGKSGRGRITANPFHGLLMK